jgi:type IV secretion system protein VirB8
MAVAKPPKLKLKSWYSSKYQIVSAQRNILFFVSFFAVTTVMVSVIFVKTIMSSKSLVPYVIELEEKTRIPVVVEQLDKTSFTADMTLKRYFLYNYLKAVAGYNPATFKEDYRKVRLQSSYNVFNGLYDKMNPRSNKSPAKIVGNAGLIEIDLKSMTFVNPNKVTVRYRTRKSGQIQGFPNTDMIADIEFIFANLDLTAEERYINPLGFQVVRYTADQELNVRGFDE